MLTRHTVTPQLTADESVSFDDVLEHLRVWKADTATTIAALQACRERVDESAKQLESPRAAAEYVEFFVDLFGRAATDLETLIAEIPQGLQRAHLDTMRQIASNAAAEQRQCLMFRDKWINRPLPYEQMRPFLEEISKSSRDQLEDYRELTAAAARLEALAPPHPEQESSGRALDRRALFTRWFGK
jgi:hypothetical protein